MTSSSMIAQQELAPFASGIVREKVFVSWSSGKDSAWALHALRQNPNVHVTGLFCTINKTFGRVAIHGVRTELVKQQAIELNLPLHFIEIPYPCDNATYVNAFKTFASSVEKKGVECFAFGDLFLENVRSYREELLAGMEIKPLFPLWGASTLALSKEMVSGGLKAVITSVNPKLLNIEFCGRFYDDSFLKSLPKEADPCGENGEFHSLVVDGPMFQNAIPFLKGETITRDGICYTDMMLKPLA